MPLLVFFDRGAEVVSVAPDLAGLVLLHVFVELVRRLHHDLRIFLHFSSCILDYSQIIDDRF